MRARFLTAAALLALAVPTAAQAQNVATVTASATVQASLVANTTHQLNFGTLAMGDNQSIAASGTGALGSLTLAGRGQVHVQHNSAVGVTTSIPTVLTRVGGTATLAFTPSCAISSTSAGNATDLGSCGPFNLSVTTLGTNQSTFIFVGGTVTGDAAAGIGTFTGDMVFTFTSTN